MMRDEGVSHSDAGHGKRWPRFLPRLLCLAWMLAKSPVVIPIPGASRPETILDSVRAAGLELSTVDLARLDETG